MIDLLKLVIIIFICCYLTQCATIVTPLGGSKDQTPPKLLSSTTENFATNFKASSITLTFDEYVKLNNISQNISTSPPLGNAINFTAIKNKVFITFKGKLEEDLTYHINFGKSIQDVNEGNGFENFQFIFSTGDKIDSLGVKGLVVPAKGIEITSNTLVGLYRDLSDSAFYKSPPFYYSFVEKDGSFSLTNIKNGKYVLSILSDANGNKFYDLPNESIGFLFSPLILDSNITNLTIPLFISEPETNRVKSFTGNIDKYRIEYELIKSLTLSDSLNLHFSKDSLLFNYQYILNEERNLVTVLLDSSINNLKRFISVMEINNELVDTFQHTISSLKQPEQKLTILATNFLLNDTIIIRTDVPIVRIDKYALLIDDQKQDTLQLKIVLGSDNQLFIILDDMVKNKIVYTLLLEDSTFLDNLGRYNRTYTNKVIIDQNEDRGSINFQISSENDSIQYILSLKDAAQNVIKRKFVLGETSSWKFNNLIPGEYILEIIEDGNLNGIWNSGSIINKKYPEEVYNYSKSFVVRSNWELEEKIVLGKYEK